jgi:hypothetical protein
MRFFNPRQGFNSLLRRTKGNNQNNINTFLSSPLKKVCFLAIKAKRRQTQRETYRERERERERDNAMTYYTF